MFKEFLLLASAGLMVTGSAAAADTELQTR